MAFLVARKTSGKSRYWECKSYFYCVLVLLLGPSQAQGHPGWNFTARGQLWLQENKRPKICLVHGNHDVRKTQFFSLQKSNSSKKIATLFLYIWFCRTFFTTGFSLSLHRPKKTEPNFVLGARVAYSEDIPLALNLYLKATD